MKLRPPLLAAELQIPAMPDKIKITASLVGPVCRETILINGSYQAEETSFTILIDDLGTSMFHIFRPVANNISHFTTVVVLSFFTNTVSEGETKVLCTPTDHLFIVEYFGHIAAEFRNFFRV